MKFTMNIFGLKKIMNLTPTMRSTDHRQTL